MQVKIKIGLQLNVATQRAVLKKKTRQRRASTNHRQARRLSYV